MLSKEWSEVDDFTENHLGQAERISILVVDGTARTQLYLASLRTNVLPTVRSMNGTCYVLLAYGDFTPNSPVVSTVYVGFDWEAMVHALDGWTFVGGSVARNAVHEGLAAALDTLNTLSNTHEGSNITLISTTLSYEDFYAHVRVRKCPRYRGQTVEELMQAAKRQKIKLSFFWPTIETGTAIQKILGKVYSSEEIKSVEVSDWYGSNASYGPTRPRSESPPDSSLLPDTSGALETAVRQFLAAVLKLPQAQRAEAIKRHLESPAYSQEYKQCLVTMVRTMQAAAKGQPQKPPVSAAITHPGKSPLLAPRGGRTPVWRGRVAFRTTNDSYFDVGAFAMANPKSVNPQVTPSVSEYHVDRWPLVLAISSFVSVQSPAVAKSVPICKLVELIPMTPEGALNVGEESAVGMRNLLTSRHLVGLVRLGATHAMLIAARPNQLIGMVLSRQAASSASLPSASVGIPQPDFSIAAHPTEITARPPGIIPRPTPEVSWPRPDLASPVTEPTLTPDAILRQHRPGTASAPIPTSSSPPPPPPSSLLEGTTTIDVFNALLGVQITDFDEAIPAMNDGGMPLDFDFGAPDSSYDQTGALFDNFE